jgi:hypothetical protein
MSRDIVNGENGTKQDAIDRTSTKIPTWDDLIHDAEAQIKQAQNRVAALRKSIRFFAKRRESGTQFPSFQK